MSAADDLAADAVLARALRGPVAWSAELQPDRVVARSLQHGIAGCLAGRLENWPPEAAQPLRETARGHAMWEMRHRQVLVRLLASLDEAGVRMLLMKGSALAYDLYDSPAARMRCDSDILVDRGALARARTVLLAQGFQRVEGAPETEELLSLQETWLLVTGDGLHHLIDLHHQAFAAALLDDLIPFEAAWARARPLPALGPVARGLPLDMAMVLACTHLAKHAPGPAAPGEGAQAGGSRLIWLLDIDLLARRLGEEDWDLVLDRALAHRVGAVCLRALEEAVRLLGTPLPPKVRQALAAAPAETAASRYLLSQGRAGRLWSNLLANRGRRRLDYLRHGLFPTAAHMRAKYPDRPREPLALLYLRRIAGFVSSEVLGKRP